MCIISANAMPKYRSRILVEECRQLDVYRLNRALTPGAAGVIGARRRADFGDIRRALKLKSLVHETMDRWYVTHL